MGTTAVKYQGEELQLFSTATNWKRYLAAVLGSYICGRVAEIGAGIGGSSVALINERCSQWVCVEPDAVLVRELRGRLLGDGRGDERFAVVCGDIACIGDRSFDTILYLDVLEHIADDRAEVTAASRALAPGGRLVALCPAHQWLYIPFDRAIGHHRRYTGRDLAALTPPGIAAQRFFYLDSCGLILSAANRALLRQDLPTPRQIVFWDRIVVPCSRRVDRFSAHRIGKSVVAVWRKPSAAGGG